MRNKLFTLLGRSQTITEWAKEYGRNRGTIYSRLRDGMTLLEALQKPTDRTQRITIWGETRRTDEWAKAAGITRNGLYSRRRSKWSEADLATPRTVKKPGITAFGKTMSLRGWERELGISAGTIHYRIQTCGMTPEQALTMPVDQSRRPRFARALQA